MELRVTKQHGTDRGPIIMSENKKKSDRMFRFQNLEIWKKAIEIGEKLMDIADDLEKRKLFRFAEQVRGASLSMINNTCPVK